MVSKPQITPKYCVAIRFEMLTYCEYAPLSNQIDALSLDFRGDFKTTFGFLNLMSLKTWPWERHLAAIIPLFTMSFELSAISCEFCELGEQELEGDQD